MCVYFQIMFSYDQPNQYNINKYDLPFHNYILAKLEEYINIMILDKSFFMTCIKVTWGENN